MGIHIVKTFLPVVVFLEFFATEKIVHYFSIVKKLVKIKSWHFPRGTMSLMRGVMSLKKVVNHCSKPSEWFSRTLPNQQFSFLV